MQTTLLYLCLVQLCVEVDVHLWQTLQLLLLVEPLAALEQMAGMSVCRWRGYALGSVLGIPPLTTDDSWNLSM